MRRAIVVEVHGHVLRRERVHRVAAECAEEAALLGGGCELQRHGDVFGVIAFT